MKNLQLVVVCCLLFVSGYGQSVNKIEVIDFHSTHRCITCKAIESNTKLVLETNFEKELKEVWQLFIQKIKNQEIKVQKEIIQIIKQINNDNFENIINDDYTKNNLFNFLKIFIVQPT